MAEARQENEREVRVVTVGHSTRSLDELVSLLAKWSVGHLADVRKIPRSRAYPHFAEETLRAALAERRIGYEHVEALGGRRARSKTVPPETNAGWEVQSFHNYADWALGDSFQRALDALLRRARTVRVAVMCSEAVWWRCHRRIITDWLIARGEPVLHLLDETHAQQATLTPFAQLRDGRVTYPATPP